MATSSDPLLQTLLDHVQALTYPRQAALLAQIAHTGVFDGKWVLEHFPTMKEMIDELLHHLSGGAPLLGGSVALFKGSRYALRVAAAAVYAYVRWRHAADILGNGRLEYLRRVVSTSLAKHPSRRGTNPPSTTFMEEFAFLADCMLPHIDPAHEIGILRDVCNLLKDKLLAAGFETDSKGTFKRAPGTWSGSSPPAFVQVQLEILWTLTGIRPKRRHRQRTSPARHVRARRDSDSNSNSSATTEPSSFDDEEGIAWAHVFDENDFAAFQLQDSFASQPAPKRACFERFARPFDAAPIQMVAQSQPLYANSAYERPHDDLTEGDMQLFQLLADMPEDDVRAVLEGDGNF